jgi:GT2 family glycosyltransferase
MLIDVIITANTQPKHEQMLINCIQSLRNSEDKIRFDITVVESTNRVFNAGQDKTILFDRPEYNCNRAMKLGMPYGAADWVVMASNDLIFMRGWYTALLEAQAKRPDILSWGTWSNLWSWHPNLFPGAQPEIIEGYRTGHELTGWNIITKRHGVLDVIDLHERVSFWYSDNIYADELQKHGIRHALCTTSIVNHLVSQTWNLTDAERDTARKEYEASKANNFDQIS